MIICRKKFEILMDAMLFYCCGDVCTDTDDDKSIMQAKVAKEFCEEFGYKSENVHYWMHKNGEDFSDEPEVLEIIKPFLKKKIY